MKCKHKYSTNKKGVVEDLFCIEVGGVGGVRQDSLYDQLKDLMFVADSIGCYDASDYLRGVVEKIEDKQKTPSEPVEPRTTFCHKCPEKQIQQDLFDEKCQYIAGCNNLTPKEWDNKDHPCPLDGSKRIIKCP